MSTWRSTPSGLHARQYALIVCQELRWPKSANVQLLQECIEAIAEPENMLGGFWRLMEAIEEAKLQGLRIDRWFFQDGRYNEIPVPASTKKAKKTATPSLFAN